MKLYLEKRGCDFFHGEGKQSDLEDYRLFLEYINKKGQRICGDVSRGVVRGTNKRGKMVVISENGLYEDFQVEDHKGCWRYYTSGRYCGSMGDYTKKTVLELVNGDSAVQYDEVVLVGRLPAEAFDYPAEVLELEKKYLEAEHKALFNEVLEAISENPHKFYNGGQYVFSKLSAEEYKECALVAFRGAKDKVETLDQSAEAVAKYKNWKFSRLCKHFFMDQQFVNPLADTEFIEKLRAVAPVQVGRYA